ncbi:MAG: glutathione S-transferase N-terminal domain-containing protein, partial [Oleiphilaceae bacterium]|nr:glutathione S-transferase N-terminal domain-containing protein [Oleiphilaceae bacterium]
MYTLYFLPDACSLATQVVLHELNLPVSLVNKQTLVDFNAINPVGTVPVLQKDSKTYTEGA